jgi:hypothetical protein
MGLLAGNLAGGLIVWRRPAAGLEAETYGERDRPFQIARASFKGQGLQAVFRAACWEELRDIIYRHRPS